MTVNFDHDADHNLNLHDLLSAAALNSPSFKKKEALYTGPALNELVVEVITMYYYSHTDSPSTPLLQPLSVLTPPQTHACRWCRRTV
jgi:hypothetical protein